MSQRARLAIFLGCTALYLAAAGPQARAADTYLEVFGGVASSKNRGITAEQPVDDLSATFKPDYDPAFSGGIRMGLWLRGNSWLGFAGDLSYFRAAATGADTDVLSFAPLILFRVPLLAGTEDGTEMLHAYGGLGPSLYYADADVAVRPPLTRPVSADTFDVGLQLIAGMNWRINRAISLFGEYRFTRHRIEAEDLNTSPCLFFCVVTDTVTTTLETHHLLAGVTFWF